MKVRSKKALPRKTAGGQPTPKPIATPYSFPAPVRGWILNENLAQPSPAGALVLENFVPTLTGIRPRAGCQKYATLGAPVQSLFSYQQGGTRKFFGTTDAGIFDISTVVDAEATVSPTVTGQTSGKWHTEQFGTVGGSFLYAVNGVDDAQLFDGTTWAAVNGTSALAITGVATSDLSNVWSFASRLFFVEKGTMSAWFLPVDSIAGAAVEFSLAGIFKNGGSLLFGATWSLDAGDGLDDKCVFVSTEGEVAVYEGTNPNSASDWRKAGVYQISSPLGAKATMQAGGDLLIAAESGLVPLSQAINNDVAALSPLAVSAPIAPHWQERAAALKDREWEIIKLAQKNMMIVSQPSDLKASVLVANLQTGAWSRFTGWKADCLGEFNNSGFFGSPDGAVYEMEKTGADSGANYTCAYLGRFDPLGAAGIQKTVQQMRTVFQIGRPISVQTSVAVDFDAILSGAPNSVATTTDDGGWNTAIWDVSTWGGITKQVGADLWSSIGRTGYAFAPELQMTFGVPTAPVAELVSIDVTYEAGALVS